MVWTWTYCCVFDTWFTTNDLLKWLQCSLEKYGPIFFLDWSRQHPCAFKDFTFALDSQALLPPFLFLMLDAFWIPSTVVDISWYVSCGCFTSLFALFLCDLGLDFSATDARRSTCYLDLARFYFHGNNSPRRLFCIIY